MKQSVIAGMCLVFCCVLAQNTKLPLHKNSHVLYKSVGDEPDIRMMEVVGSPTIALGDVLHGTVTNGTFRIRNTGGQPLTIRRLVPTCPCIKGSVATTNAIAPGAEATIHMTLDTRTVKGGFERGMWVMASDMGTPYLQLAFAGTVKPIFEGVPERMTTIKFEAINQPVTNTFELIATQPGWSLETPVVETSNESMDVRTSLAPVPDKSGAYLLQVIVKSGKPGRHRATLSLPVSGAFETTPIQMTLTGYLSSPLSTMPREIALALGGSGAQTFRMILRGPRATGLEPDKVEFTLLPQGVTASALAGRSPNELMLRVEIADSALDALYSDRKAAVELRYQGIGEVAIPITVRAEGESADERQPTRRSQHPRRPGRGGGMRSLRF